MPHVDVHAVRIRGAAAVLKVPVHVLEAMEHRAALVVTTSKDAAKMSAIPLGGLPVVAAQIAMELTEPGRWQAFLHQQRIA